MEEAKKNFASQQQEQKTQTQSTLQPISNPKPQGSTVSQPKPQQQHQGFSEDSIKTLTNLGFSRDQAVQALKACSGNTEMAASLLFQSSGGF